MDAWVDEPAASDGHRQIVTSGSYGVVGFGHASDATACYRGFDGGDFAGDKPAVSFDAAAAPKPIAGPAGTFRVYATWADKTGGAPAALRAVADGACADMTKELGDPKLNATYYADVPLANGCHNVYVLGSAASRARGLSDDDRRSPSTSVARPVVPTRCRSRWRAADGTPPPPADMSGGARDMATGGVPDLSTGPSNAPSVTLTAPANGERYTLGSTVTVQATASAAAGHTLARVVANWTRFGYTSTYPLTLANGQWTLALQVTQRRRAHHLGHRHRRRRQVDADAERLHQRAVSCHRRGVRRALAIGFVLCALARVAVAQDAFEIQVYDVETAAPKDVGLEVHLNYFASGVTTTSPEGGSGPSCTSRRCAACRCGRARRRRPCRATRAP